MIPVTVENLSISKVGFVVLLKSQADERTLPIYIGPPEAQSILIHLNKVNLPRPMTHDLLKNVLDILEARLEKVQICDLKDETFYAKLVISFESQALEVDSRPSDAIALALRCNAPIYVADRIMKQAGVVLAQHEAKMEEARSTLRNKGTSLEPPEDTQTDDPLAALRTSLVKAIKEERYEDAARLRDAIKRASNSN